MALVTKAPSVRRSRVMAARKTEKLRIEYVDLDVLRRAPRNAKLHALDELGHSFRRWGYVEPIVIDERTGCIVAGHGRLDELLAMRAAGDKPPERVVVRKDKWLVPVLRGVSFRDEREAEAYLLAANQLVVKGGFDPAVLAEMVADAQKAAGLVGTGYDAADIDRIAAEAKAAAEAASAGAGGGVAERAPDQSSRAQVGFVVLIDCTDERHQLLTIEDLMSRGYKCRALT